MRWPCVFFVVGSFASKVSESASGLRGDPKLVFLGQPLDLSVSDREIVEEPLVGLSRLHRANLKRKGTNVQGLVQRDLDNLFISVLGPTAAYNKEVRPVPLCEGGRGCSPTIQVILGVHFSKLLSVDEKRNELRMLAVMTLLWPDHRLDYNMSEFVRADSGWRSDADFVPVDANLVWRPDVQLANSAQPIEDMFTPKAYLFDSVKRRTAGYNVQIHKPVVLSVKCNLVMTEFPFDKQSCPFHFRAWSASEDWTRLQPMQTPPGLWVSPGWEEASALSDKNEEFDVTGVNTTRAAIVSDYFGRGWEAYSDVTYVVHLSRFSHYYMCTIVLPMSVLVLLALGVFFVDPDRGERLGFSITLILTVMAVTFFTAEELPKTGSGDSWLQLFQTLCYILTLFPLFVTLGIEVIRRMYMRQRRPQSAEENRIHAVDSVVDDWFRLPFACVVVVFQGWVLWKYLSIGGNLELSIKLLFGFIIFFASAMLVLAALELNVLLRSRLDKALGIPMATT
eukprot:TRINITY_DN13250_c1_g1_i2.p1 TRINITY_DN13250_c1_g1~~TRINITY_DN13250_c1_g1_i2.p1  ORF type:complete len:507 (+),score=63.75 TRINITY_DN13250_c1_g1_i2:102-1622(+)